MRAVTYDPASDDFQLNEMPMPEPGRHDVLVKVLACGLNPVDAKINFWHSAAEGMSNQWVPGLDVSGEIVATGTAVQDWQIGDRVLYHGDMFRPHGGYAEYAIHDSRTLISHPDLAPEAAASIPCAGWTAWRALVDKLAIAGQKSIFIAGGAGGVGNYAIQIARYFGVEKIITTSSAANHDYLATLGATHLIDYRQEDVYARVMEMTDGDGVPVALDAVGGDNDIVTASVLGFEGQMVELVRTVRPAEYPDAFMKGLSFHQLSLGSGHRYGDASRKAMTEAGVQLASLIECGRVETPRLDTIGLEQVGDTLKMIRQQRTVGKIVMKLES
ncbi:zinc-binding dehydrogenase [Spongorhabdus nitratireducens]